MIFNIRNMCLLETGSELQSIIKGSKSSWHDEQPYNICISVVISILFNFILGGYADITYLALYWWLSRNGLSHVLFYRSQCKSQKIFPGMDCLLS